MAGAGLFWEKSTAGWLVMADLFWEKSTVGWWLISQTDRAMDQLMWDPLMHGLIQNRQRWVGARSSFNFDSVCSSHALEKRKVLSSNFFQPEPSNNIYKVVCTHAYFTYLICVKDARITFFFDRRSTSILQFHWEKYSTNTLKTGK
jgi:hypothetical protein